MLILILIIGGVLGISHSPTRVGMGFYPEIAPFTAAPENIRAGDAVTLSWVTRGAVSVTLEAAPEGGATGPTIVQSGLPPVGSLKVQPRETTTYRLWCQTVFSGHACLPAEAKVEVQAGHREVFRPTSGGL